MARQGRILIVDDSIKWQEQLVDMLKGEGYYVDSATSINQALERLSENFYHLLSLDIRMNKSDANNIDGINLLSALADRGLHDATKVIILSAFGNQERMRTSFKDYKVVDFLSKENFSKEGFKEEFLENIRRWFSQEVHINLALDVHWRQISGPEQVVVNLEMDGTLVKSDTDLQKRMAEELEDLLCRLFYRAKSVLVRPLTQGHSGTGVLRVQPFYTTGGSGHEVVIKLGDFHKIEEEYSNFKEYVQPFLGGGRNTTILDFRRTPRLGGIIYSLLGTVNDQLVDFADFYRRAEVSQIGAALDRLFRETCGVWYASCGYLDALNLSAGYQRLLESSPKELGQTVLNQLPSVQLVSSAQGKSKLRFNHLRSRRAFTDPFLAMDGKSLAHPTYLCITHGDFNQHNLLVDSSGHIWMIDFQETSQGHILRDVAMLDSVVRFQLLTAEEATLKERLHMEEALCSIDRFSQVEQLANKLQTQNQALAKTYATVVHIRTLACRLVNQNPEDDMSEYSVALLYNALNTLQFSSLSLGQREHALLSASLLSDRLRLNS